MTSVFSNDTEGKRNDFFLPFFGYLVAELMLLGFISLLLVAFQGTIQRICVRESLMHHLRPCKKDDPATAAAHFSVGFSGGARRLLAGGGADSTHCQKKVRRTRFLELSFVFEKWRFLLEKMN